MAARRYPIVIEPTGTGFSPVTQLDRATSPIPQAAAPEAQCRPAKGSAYSPDVPGCVAAGDTELETRLNFQEALVAHFEALREVGELIPEPHTAVDYVEVAA